MSKQQQRDTIVYGVWTGMPPTDRNPASVPWKLVFTATDISTAVDHAVYETDTGCTPWWVILGYSRRGGVFVGDVCLALNSAPHYAGLAALMTWLDDADFWGAMEHIACTANNDLVGSSMAGHHATKTIGSRPRSAHVEPPLARPGDKGIDLGTGETF